MVIEGRPAPQLLASISPERIEVDRAGSAAAVAISIENSSATTAYKVVVGVTLPEGVAWLAPRAQVESDLATCSAGDVTLGDPAVLCYIDSIPGRSGAASQGVLVEIPVVADGDFEQGEVLVEVSASEPPASTSTRALLVGVGEAPPSLEAQARVSTSVVSGLDEPFAVRLVLDVSARVDSATEAVLYVSLPEEISFEPGSGEESAELGVCTAADPGEAAGACALKLPPGTSVRLAFRLTGEEAIVREWIASSIGTSLVLGVESRREAVEVILASLVDGQGGGPSSLLPAPVGG